MKTESSLVREIIIGVLTVGAVVFSIAYIVSLATQHPTLPTEKPAMVEKSDRFKISSHGSFAAGHGAHIREILIIKDTKTGKEYLGVTGVGVTEIVGSGKSATEE